MLRRLPSEKELAVDWWVYDSANTIPGGQAVVHRSDCKYVVVDSRYLGITEEGEIPIDYTPTHGQPEHDPEQHGRWLGPFASPEDALAVARASGRRVAAICGFCAG